MQCVKKKNSGLLDFCSSVTITNNINPTYVKKLCWTKTTDVSKVVLIISVNVQGFLNNGYPVTDELNLTLSITDGVYNYVADNMETITTIQNQTEIKVDEIE